MLSPVGSGLLQSWESVFQIILLLKIAGTELLIGIKGLVEFNFLYEELGPGSY